METDVVYDGEVTDFVTHDHDVATMVTGNQAQNSLATVTSSLSSLMNEVSHMAEKQINDVEQVMINLVINRTTGTCIINDFKS